MEIEQLTLSIYSFAVPSIFVREVPYLSLPCLVDASTKRHIILMYTCIYSQRTCSRSIVFLERMLADSIATNLRCSGLLDPAELEFVLANGVLYPPSILDRRTISKACEVSSNPEAWFCEFLLFDVFL